MDQEKEEGAKIEEIILSFLGGQREGEKENERINIKKGESERKRK